MDAKDGLDEHNKEYNEGVRALIQKVLPVDEETAWCKYDKAFIDLLSESLVNVNQKNAWNENHYDIFERFMMGRTRKECTLEEVKMVQAGVYFLMPEPFSLQKHSDFDYEALMPFLVGDVKREDAPNYINNPEKWYGLLLLNDPAVKIQSFWREYRTRKSAGLERKGTRSMNLN